jgi:AAA15 family ATPase/GTPase
MMLTSIHIEGFKNFKDTKIESLRKVNLILGGQNVGKTSLLEAVCLGIDDVNNANQVSSIFRLMEGGDKNRFFEGTFNENGFILVHTDTKDYEFNASWITSWGDNRERASTIRFSKNNFVYEKMDHGFRRLLFISPHSENGQDKVDKSNLFLPISVHAPSQATTAALLDKSVIKRKIKELIKLLQQIEPRLEDVRALAPDGEIRVYVELNDHSVYLPLPQLGHGFSRLVHLYCSLLVTDSKLALIDEIENGIHYSSLPTMFKGIQQIATNNDIQSLITTHSWECLRAACEVFSDKPELFQVIRLERDGDNTKAVCIEGERMLRMMERDMEVR